MDGSSQAAFTPRSAGAGNTIFTMFPYGSGEQGMLHCCHWHET
jgi:hypothetical protein